MKCPSCGYENREDAPYCNMCQGSFNKAPLTSPPSAPPPALQAAVKTEQNKMPGKRNWFQNHFS